MPESKLKVREAQVNKKGEEGKRKDAQDLRNRMVGNTFLEQR